MNWSFTRNWRIQNQILLPIMVATVIGISLSTLFNVRGLIENENERVQNQVEQLFTTLTGTSFPLTRSVLIQVEKISGIHLAVRQGERIDSSFVDDQGGPLNDDTFRFDEIGSTTDASSADSPAMNPLIVSILGEDFVTFHHHVPARQIDIVAFYPRGQFYAAIRKVVLPQILSGGVTLIVVVALIILISRSVTAPIQQLKRHVHRIAEGNFVARHPERRDEIGELFQSVNETASKLQQYERKVRAQEKLLTLDQMAGGIAHQMKNSITGCRLALDFHREHCQGDLESLQVAIRQLTIMEDFQKRFFSLTRDANPARVRIDLAEVVQQYAKLLEPFARHLGVDLQVQLDDEPHWILGNESLVQQLVSNLVINAIEAAGANRQNNANQVTVGVQTKQGRPTLTVIDSGPGVPPEIAERIFEPLVTHKPDGIGLGLAIAKQTAQQHDAEIGWTRADGTTRFEVVFPQPEVANPDRGHLSSNSDNQPGSQI